VRDSRANDGGPVQQLLADQLARLAVLLLLLPLCRSLLPIVLLAVLLLLLQRLLTGGGPAQLLRGAAWRSSALPAHACCRSCHCCCALLPQQVVKAANHVGLQATATQQNTCFRANDTGPTAYMTLTLLLDKSQLKAVTIVFNSHHAR
jgi:hypothetical protein